MAAVAPHACLDLSDEDLCQDDIQVESLDWCDDCSSGDGCPHHPPTSAVNCDLLSEPEPVAVEPESLSLTEVTVTLAEDPLPQVPGEDPLPQVPGAGVAVDAENPAPDTVPASSPESPSSPSGQDKLAATLDHVHSVIVSLLVGETIVRQVKRAAEVRLLKDLAEYDAGIDAIIAALNETRHKTKIEMSDAIEPCLKQLEAQSDELLISIGQLQGLALVLANSLASDDPLSPVDMSLLNNSSLLKHFDRPVVEPALFRTAMATLDPLKDEMVNKLSTFAVEDLLVRVCDHALLFVCLFPL